MTKLIASLALAELVVLSASLVLDGYEIPAQTLAKFGDYPNPLQLTDADRAKFHPVVDFPTIRQENGTSIPNFC